MIQEHCIGEIAAGQELSGATFLEDYVTPGKPVLVKGAVRGWEAVKRWEPAYFSEIGGDLEVPVKMADVVKGQTVQMRLRDYVSALYEYESESGRSETASGTYPYLHDIPVFHLIPELAEDVSPFPTEYFPRWYHRNILDYAQFFMSATGSKTPLHFDTLQTHNLFFQIHGRKEFILIPGSQKDLCYMRGWRWSAVDASCPDYDRYPRFRHATPTTVVVDPGDMLFMPSGTLHEVTTLSPSVSFNIDWHTPGTAIKGVLSGLHGAPRDNVYYNTMIALGLCLHVPSTWVFPYYKSYLSYIS